MFRGRRVVGQGREPRVLGTEKGRFDALMERFGASEDDVPNQALAKEIKRQFRDAFGDDGAGFDPGGPARNETRAGKALMAVVVAVLGMHLELAVDDPTLSSLLEKARNAAGIALPQDGLARLATDRD